MQLRTTLMASALCGLMAVTGCNSTTSGPSASNADPRMTNDEFSVDQSSYATACVTGALITGVSCTFIADSGSRAVCLAAAAAGCAVFMGGNALLDNLRKGYHTKEQQLDALAKQMEENRQKAAYMLATANQVYEEDHAKLAQMKKEIDKNTADRKQAEKTLARYDGNILVLKDNIDYHEKQIALFKETKTELAGNETLTAAERKQIKECDREIARLQSNIDEMRGLLTNFTNDRNVLNIALNDGSEIKAKAA